MVSYVKVLKDGYPKRVSYNDFYTRYHELDFINKKITLSKHLNNGTDMRALVIEIHKRLFPKMEKNYNIFGEEHLYMKLESGYLIEDMLFQWKNKIY